MLYTDHVRDVVSLCLAYNKQIGMVVGQHPSQPCHPAGVARQCSVSSSTQSVECSGTLSI